MTSSGTPPPTTARRWIRKIVPRFARSRLGSLERWLSTRPPVGLVRFGTLRRVTPISRRWGYDRGLPVDRHYIEAFIEEHRADVRGYVLEIREPGYTYRFGSDIERSDV